MRLLTQFAFILVLGSALACSSKPGAPSGPRFTKPALETAASENFRPAQIRQIVVYPLQTDSMGKVDTDILSAMTHQLVTALQAGTDIEILNATQPDSTATALKSASTKASPLQTQARTAAQSLQTQGVIYGVVSRYQASDGTALGGSSLAAVAFQLWLLDSKTGKVVWTGNFKRSEEPLTDNLLGLKDKFKDGFGYKSAEDLARSGFSDVAEELDRERRAAENTKSNI